VNKFTCLGKVLLEEEKVVYIYFILMVFFSIHMKVRARKGQLLKIVHLPNLKRKHKALQIEPQDHSSESEEEPLPVHDPLHHRLAPPMPAEGVVLEGVKDCAVQGRHPKLHFLLRTSSLGAQLDTKLMIRAYVRLQIEPSAGRTLRTIHPVLLEIFQKHKAHREQQEGAEGKDEQRSLRHASLVL